MKAKEREAMLKRALKWRGSPACPCSDVCVECLRDFSASEINRERRRASEQQKKATRREKRR